jgi:hypothetical protein
MRSAGVTAALVLAASLGNPIASRAATFQGAADLTYDQYCTGGCLNPSNPSAGTVTVTVQGNDLLFDVDLATGFFFMNNPVGNLPHGHQATFAFSLISGLTGVSVTVESTDTGNSTSKSNWTVVPNAAAGDGVGTALWSYILQSAVKSSSNTDLEFLVSANQALTLADIAQTNDPNGVALWFAADVSSPIGATGYVGADRTRHTTQEGTTPLPAALPLMGSVLGFGYLVSGWRRRRRAALAA